MERSPLFLAALASAAVPGLDPASVEALPSTPGQLFDVAFVEDTLQRRWVVRAPRTPAAAAQMDLTVALLGLLARRLPFALPMPRGFVSLTSGGRAAVYPYLPGRNLDFAALPPGNGIAAELGRAIAALHNADHRLFDEAGLPTYDADTYRTRRLSDLDRAAETGRVPAALLARWERALEDVNLWRFAPTPVHGDLTGDQVLAVFDDPDDAATGQVKGVTGWEDAKVADPADDFAALVGQASPEALDTVMEAYAHARAERPDPNLLVRARLCAELQRLSGLLAALAAGHDETADEITAELEDLDERVRAEETVPDDYHSMSLRPRRSRAIVAPPVQVDDEDDDDVPADDPAAAEGGGGSEHGIPAERPEPVVAADPDEPEPGPDAGPGPQTAPEPGPDAGPESARQTETKPDAGPEPEPEPEQAPPALVGEPVSASPPMPRPPRPTRTSRDDQDTALAPVVTVESTPPLEFEFDQPDDPPSPRGS